MKLLDIPTIEGLDLDGSSSTSVTTGSGVTTSDDTEVA
jgi:hypothetical protein